MSDCERIRTKPRVALKWIGVIWVALFGVLLLTAFAVNLYVHVWQGRQ